MDVEDCKVKVRNEFPHIGLRWVNRETKTARKQAEGQTTEGKILTCLFDGESIQCKAFAERRPFRNLSPYIPQFAITSTTKDISSHETTLRQNAFCLKVVS